MTSGKRRVRGKFSGKVRRRLNGEVAARLLQSLHSRKPVQGLTHAFYRYPARFSPQFARSVIDAFSRPGDTVLDPFVGGGTTLIEGLALGRRVVAIDLNSLAVFIARVKSTPLSSGELASVRRLIRRLHKHGPRLSSFPPEAKQEALFLNVPWWIRKCILTILDAIRGIRNPRVLDFLRCGLLKTAQWALDCREIIPSYGQLFQAFCTEILEMCKQMEEYRAALRAAGVPLSCQVSRYRRLLLRSAVNVHEDARIPREWLPAKLVVTSPPYPGVHVLYHRWQVRGRRETPMPFGILGSQDGHFPSYYTFGDRRRSDLYFETLTAAYRSIAKLLAPNSLVVQLVSFAKPRSDVAHFLRAMVHAGFEECSPLEAGLGQEDRIWRMIPNRKWYAGYRDGFPAGKELLLLHRIKRAQPAG